jgi:hypothetical protein
MENETEKLTKRLMTKEEGLRHVVHSAIRQVWREEDAVANCVLVEAANQVSVDLLKHVNKPDPVWDSPYIIADKRNELRRELKKPYNFLKHADNDAASTLPIYDISSSNVLSLFLVVVRYGILCGRYTEHMKLYLGYCLICHPTLFDKNEINSLIGEHLKSISIEQYSLTKFLNVWTQALESNENYKSEVTSDCSESIYHGKKRLIANTVVT